jgi:hypothetical protein
MATTRFLILLRRPVGVAAVVGLPLGWRGGLVVVVVGLVDSTAVARVRPIRVLPVVLERLVPLLTVVAVVVVPVPLVGTLEVMLPTAREVMVVLVWLPLLPGRLFSGPAVALVPVTPRAWAVTGAALPPIIRAP